MPRGREIDEQRIAALAADGDTEAMKQIYCSYADVLTAVCSRYVVDCEAVKDVLHDSFVKAFSSIAQFSYKQPGSLGAWLKRIVVNEALAFLKKRSRIDAVSLDADDSIDISADDAPEVESLEADELMMLIKRLPDGYRTILNLYAIEGRSHREIADLLGISPETSASQLHRAKLRLAKMIRELMDSKY